MTVLFIVDRVDKYGSVDSFKQMVDSLVRNFEVKPIIVHYKKGKVIDWAIKREYEYHIIPYKSFMIPKISKFGIINFIIRFLYFINYKISLLISLKKINKMIDFKDVDVIHTNIDRVDLGIILAEKYKLPHVWHIREFGTKEDYPLIPIKNNYINIINKSNKIIFISNAVKNQWIKKGINETISNVIWDGIVDKKNIINRNKEIMSGEIIKIVFSGYICPNKGQDQLVKAAALLPDDIKNRLQIDFYGDFNKKYYNYINKVIKDNNLKNINFLGFVENVSKLYSDYDIGIMCSRCEGLGRVTVDYMNSGCLIIGSNSGANLEIITDGLNGYLYDYGNIDSLKEVIIKSIIDVDSSIEIAQNGLKFAREKFDCDNYASKVYNLYKTTIEK